MKKTVLIFIFFLITSVTIFFVLVYSKKSSILIYEFEGKKYKLVTAKNSAEWQKGLMFYKNKKELQGADGMIFIFPDKDFRSFWNKNTYLDLDVYWLDDDKIVEKDFLPSILKTKNIYTINSSVKVNKVIEIIKE